MALTSHDEHTSSAVFETSDYFGNIASSYSNVIVDNNSPKSGAVPDEAELAVSSDIQNRKSGMSLKHSDRVVISDKGSKASERLNDVRFRDIAETPTLACIESCKFEELIETNCYCASYYVNLSGVARLVCNNYVVRFLNNLDETDDPDGWGDNELCRIESEIARIVDSYNGYRVKCLYAALNVILQRHAGTGEYRVSEFESEIVQHAYIQLASIAMGKAAAIEFQKERASGYGHADKSHLEATASEYLMLAGAFGSSFAHGSCSKIHPVAKLCGEIVQNSFNGLL